MKNSRYIKSMRKALDYLCREFRPDKDLRKYCVVKIKNNDKKRFQKYASLPNAEDCVQYDGFILLLIKIVWPHYYYINNNNFIKLSNYITVEKSLKQIPAQKLWIKTTKD